jgi:hypothetical protein
VLTFDLNKWKISSVNGIGIVQLDDLNSEVVDPKEFIRIFNEERDTIKRAEIIPPKLGEKGFGKIRVVRNYPFYTTKFGAPRRNER